MKKSQQKHRPTLNCGLWVHWSVSLFAARFRNTLRYRIDTIDVNEGGLACRAFVEFVSLQNCCGCRLWYGKLPTLYSTLMYGAKFQLMFFRISSYNSVQSLPVLWLMLTLESLPLMWILSSFLLAITVKPSLAQNRRRSRSNRSYPSSYT